MPRPDPEVIERPHHLQPAQHPEHPVVLPPRRLGVEMAADIDRRQVRLGPLAPREHRPHRVDARGQPRRIAPPLEQRPPLGVGVGQRLTVVAPRHPRPDLGHRHQAVPQPSPVDLQVRSGCVHLRFPPGQATYFWFEGHAAVSARLAPHVGLGNAHRRLTGRLRVRPRPGQSALRRRRFRFAPAPGPRRRSRRRRRSRAGRRSPRRPPRGAPSALDRRSASPRGSVACPSCREGRRSPARCRP